MQQQQQQQRRRRRQLRHVPSRRRMFGDRRQRGNKRLSQSNDRRNETDCRTPEWTLKIIVKSFDRRPRSAQATISQRLAPRRTVYEIYRRRLIQQQK
jgi:hypothetical protein